ncbi:homeobox-leucine zipper protein HDG12-like isoform X2 [Cornus florida]|uniref:homeobox-leucine zipper protein HDG12-like isoform X2 n=1 Tax=Cornus florida TaxID=4283 RepID=UPI0028A1862A|nr:homeobox-leucine zipper protein HDG12-like isoform X2 [Cornus florida]
MDKYIDSNMVYGGNGSSDEKESSDSRKRKKPCHHIDLNLVCGGNGSSDDEGGLYSRKRKKPCHHYSAQEIQKLIELSSELGVKGLSHALGNPMLPYIEKSLIIETAGRARDELKWLLHVNEPMWIKSPIAGVVYVLNCEVHDKLFPRVSHLKSSSALIESSKCSCELKMAGSQLVNMLLHSEKWMNFFPTIVRTARTIEVIDTGMLGNQGDFLKLQLMYGQMHILSPLVAPREFLFLRFCQQLEPGSWVVGDVSYDCSRHKIQASPFRSWRLPSGCMIRNMPNGYSKVTWVERVEVDDKSQTHHLFRDLVCNSLAYGAQRWVITLQRSLEKYTYLLRERALTQQVRKAAMILSHRMV